MKTIKKNIFKIAAVSMLVGIILIIVGLSIGIKNHIYMDNRGIHVVDTNDKNSNNLTYIKEDSLEAFTNITINASLDDIEFIPSDHYGIEINHYLRNDNSKVIWSNTDGTLKIDTAEKFHGFAWFNFDLSFINWFSNNRSNSNTIKIYYPSDSNFNQIKVKLDLGELDISQLQATYIEIDNNLGDIQINHVNASKVNLSADLGKIKMKDCIIDDLDIDNNLGDIDLVQCVVDKLVIRADLGDVDVSGDYTGPVDIKNNLGSVSFSTKKDRSYYHLSLDVDLGSINSNQDRNAPNGSVLLEIECDLGSINLYFNH